MLEVKTEKETYSWDFCNIIFQLNYCRNKCSTFVNNEELYLATILFFFIPGREAM